MLVLFHLKFTWQIVNILLSYVIPLIVCYIFLITKVFYRVWITKDDRFSQSSWKIIHAYDPCWCSNWWSLVSRCNSNNFSISKHSLVSSSINNSSVIHTQSIWHFILGHLSHDKFLIMTQFYPYIMNDYKLCDICYFFWYKEFQCSSNFSKNVHKFELLHFDIWGLLSTSYIHGHKCVYTHVCKYFLTILDDVSVHTHTHMDNDHKFLIPQTYASKGIIHQIPRVKPPQNKMEGLKENITSSNFPKHFGLLHSHMLHSLSIESILVY